MCNVVFRCVPCPPEQLKCVMERVLDFAVCELTKIVEASFDDLLLEITKMEREQQTLEERLGRSSDRGGGDKARSGGARRRGSENDSVSPSGSEDAKEEVTVSKETTETDGRPSLGLICPAPLCGSVPLSPPLFFCPPFCLCPSSVNSSSSRSRLCPRPHSLSGLGSDPGQGLWAEVV